MSVQISSSRIAALALMAAMCLGAETAKTISVMLFWQASNHASIAQSASPSLRINRAEASLVAASLLHRVEYLERGSFSEMAADS